MPARRSGANPRGAHIGHVRPGASLSLGCGHHVGLAEHVQCSGHTEGEPLRQSAGHQVDVRVNQPRQDGTALRVDHLVAVLGSGTGGAVGDDAVGEPD